MCQKNKIVVELPITCSLLMNIKKEKNVSQHFQIQTWPCQPEGMGCEKSPNGEILNTNIPELKITDTSHQICISAV